MVGTLTPCVLLSRRLSGAPTLHRMLAAHLPWRDLDEGPFRADGPLHAVVELAASEPQAAHAALIEALQPGLWFTHLYETESRDFNRLLLHALAESGYTVLHLDRTDEVDRLFALALAQRAQVWRAHEVDTLRERLRAGESPPDLSALALQHLVQHELAYRHWMQAELAHYPHRVHTVTHAELYRSGLQGLVTVDALFGACGLGQRQARLDDASLLRLLFHADDHASGLRQYAPALQQAYALIQQEAHATIDGWAPQACPQH
ncbi:MAG: hypothetical protein LCH73_12675 [Proteobacteria bacterium]|nr:hypothetical protein [Pseudomonadota bacterium]